MNTTTVRGGVLLRARLAAALLAAFSASAAAAPGAPLGNEFQVNTYTAGDQQFPVTARSANGTAVVAWDSVGQDGSLDGIFAQRLDAAGNKLGSEFQVNTHSNNEQFFPAVAMNANGDFVVAWESNGQARVGVDVYARAFAADGTPKTPEIHLNDAGLDLYALVGAGIDRSGNFVVVWQERKVFAGSQLAKLAVLRARLVSASGTPQGASFAVAQSTSDVFRAPAVAMNSAGSFVVTWLSIARGNALSGPAGTGAGIMARRFPAGGGTAPATIPFSVNTADSQTWLDLPQVAIDDAGNFVIAWEGLHLDQTPAGVFARRYNAAAQPQGNPFKVGSAMQRHPAVGINPATGNFVVAGHGNGVYAQCFGANGAALSGEFQVNQSADDNTQFNAGVGVDTAGNFLVSWQNYGQDGSGRGVFARLFAGN